MTLSRLRALVCAAVLAVAVPPVASAETVDFEDLSINGLDIVDLGTISPYHGLTWDGIFAFKGDSGVPFFAGYDAGVLDSNAAFTGGEFGESTPAVGTVTSPTPFNFESAWFNAAFYNGLNVTAQGWRAGGQVYSQTFSVDTTGAQLVALGFTNIDELRLFATAPAPPIDDPLDCGEFNCTQFTIDNLTVTPYSPTTPVPEPSTLTRLGLGALGLARRRRRAR